MQTITAVKTGTITQTKLFLAVLALIVADALAFSVIPTTWRPAPPPPPVVHNYAVYACKGDVEGLDGVRATKKLFNGCVARYKVLYEYVCSGPNSYRVFHRNFSGPGCSGRLTTSGVSDYYVEGSCDQFQSGILSGIITVQNYINGCDGSKTHAYSCPGLKTMRDSAVSCSGDSPICIDYDLGNNVFRRSQITMLTPNTGAKTGTVYDDCVAGSASANTVKEYSCVDGVKTSRDIACPNGYSCQYGRCVYATTDPTVFCYDPDGRDITRTTVTTKYDSATGASYSAKDSCASVVRVSEQTCDTEPYFSYCRGSSSCVNGSCLYVTRSCSDNDYGVDVGFVGMTVVTNNATGATSVNVDSCLSGAVDEFSCNVSLGGADETSVACPTGQTCANGLCVSRGSESTTNYCDSADKENEDDVYVAGSNSLYSVIGGAPAFLTTFSDICEGDIIENTDAGLIRDGLLEFNCSGRTLNKRRVNCSKGCLDGACIR